MSSVYGSVPVSSDEDVLALFPQFMRGSDEAPVRDAIVAAIRVIMMTYQDASSYAAAQSDVLTATGPALRSKLAERGVEQQDGEDEETYRARGLGFQAVVTPEAIVAAVNSLIAPLTCTYLEPSLDRIFLSDGTGAWHTFIGVAPSYPDRYYPDDAAANGGIVRPSIDPGAGYMFTENTGRSFVIRVQDLSALDETIQLIYNGTKLALSDAAVPELGGATPPQSGQPADDELASSLGGVGIYLYDNTPAPADRTFLYQPTTDSRRTYDRIVATVERLRGASFRWALYVTS